MYALCLYGGGQVALRSNSSFPDDTIKMYLADDESAQGTVPVHSRALDSRAVLPLATRKCVRAAKVEQYTAQSAEMFYVFYQAF